MRKLISNIIISRCPQKITVRFPYSALISLPKRMLYFTLVISLPEACAMVLRWQKNRLYKGTTRKCPCSFSIIPIYWQVRMASELNRLFEHSHWMGSEISNDVSFNQTDRQTDRELFGLFGFTVSATARVISRRWNDDDEISFVSGGNRSIRFLIWKRLVALVQGFSKTVWLQYWMQNIINILNVYYFTWTWGRALS